MVHHEHGTNRRTEVVANMVDLASDVLKFSPDIKIWREMGKKRSCGETFEVASEAKGPVRCASLLLDDVP